MSDTNSQFVGFIGGGAIADGFISNFSNLGAIVSVNVDLDGQISVIEFTGVVSVKSKRPEGMRLAGILEYSYPEHRRFVFGNWDEKDDAFLEIIADNFKIDRFHSTS